MLRAKLDVNGYLIHELEIVRIKGEPGGLCDYRCRWEYAEWFVRDHDYNDGPWVLLKRAIAGLPDEAHKPGGRAAR